MVVRLHRRTRVQQSKAWCTTPESAGTDTRGMSPCPRRRYPVQPEATAVHEAQWAERLAWSQNVGVRIPSGTRNTHGGVAPRVRAVRPEMYGHPETSRRRRLSVVDGGRVRLPRWPRFGRGTAFCCSACQCVRGSAPGSAREVTPRATGTGMTIFAPGRAMALTLDSVRLPGAVPVRFRASHRVSRGGSPGWTPRSNRRAAGHPISCK